MQLACSTSAFKIPLDQALARVKTLGFTYVDLISIPGWGHIEPVKLAEDFDTTAAWVEETVHASGLTPIGMNVAVPAPHTRTDEANTARLQQLDAVARVMNRLGITIASFYPGYRAVERPWEDVLADSAQSIKEMLEVGKRYNVTFAIELHMFTPFETVEQGLRLLEAVPGLAVAYDPSHYAMQSIDLRDTQPLLDRAVHVHLRDAAPDKMQMPTGQGTVDFSWILDTLRARNYPGACSIEYLPGLEGVEEQITKLKELVEAQG